MNLFGGHVQRSEQRRSAVTDVVVPWYSGQIEATVWSEIPRSEPRSRVDQCVTPYFFGGAVNVLVTTSSRSTS